ncbi:MAG: helix-turn-helix transcriptional regulator [Bacteroidales bacterium]|nr:helix-turn-helix transcriptional regulator [Bacteroidales bacterium]
MYRLTDKMSFVISRDYKLLQVMSRFGLSLGFGDKTVGEVCQQSGVDSQTFLDVVNFLADGNASQDRIKSIDIPSLMSYLRNAHSYFLDFKLPNIRRKLISSIDCSVNNEVAFLILKFFDAYVEGIRQHMQYENEQVFTYVDALMENKLSNTFNIHVFASHHDDIEEKLKDLKEIIITYYPTEADNNIFYSVLFDLYTAEEDLGLHNSIENKLFIPAVTLLEREVSRKAVRQSAPQETVVEETEEEGLSKREREIVIQVAKGKANKEIAEELCISIHTVLTHRKNIAKKLQIHSPAGLTIYAIVNKLVELKDIKDISMM